MEAPEKIYINDFGSELSYDWHTEHCCENDIEYIRINTFIKKVREFLSKENNIPLWEDRGGNFGCDIPKLIEKFINYMKGE